MSKMIPRESIDVLREFVDISLDNYGFSCELFVPNNLSSVEVSDIYTKPADYTYDHYTALVFIEWAPNVHRLKALGLYVEDELPIIVYLPNQCVNDSGSEVDVDILKDSYIKVPIEYIPGNEQKNDEFVLTEPIIRGMHSAVIVKSYKAVPRRV